MIRTQVDSNHTRRFTMGPLESLDWLSRFTEETPGDPQSDGPSRQVQMHVGRKPLPSRHLAQPWPCGQQNWPLN